MNILLIGAGRMGLRHLLGLASVTGHICVVEPRSDRRREVLRVSRDHDFQSEVSVQGELDDAGAEDREWDAAILATTAQGRLELFEQVANMGVPNVLMEKPIEQSRPRVMAIAKIARQTGVSVECNLNRRCLPLYRELKELGGPFCISVQGGAFGLGCNGIHWIDFALYLAGCTTGRLIAGELEKGIIGSGRGAAFRDYGGWGVYAFDDGSRLYLSSSSGSPAPISATIIRQEDAVLIDRIRSSAIVYRRRPGTLLPNYLYGQGYIREEVDDAERINMSGVAKAWLEASACRKTCCLPTLEEAIPSHELLFDLLETSGQEQFAIT